MSETRVRLLLAAIGVGAFALLLGLEVATEDERLGLADLAQEALNIGLTVATAAAAALLAGRMRTQHEERMGLLRDLKLARAEGEGWRRRAQSHIDGLGAAIEAQFDEWGLTTAEREIGLLMLKGFVHKEIAALRGTTEATVRHQARSIYQKTGVEGRAGFCAFFLEDLLAGEDGAASRAVG